MGNRRPGTVRIIGGRWRGRRLPVPDTLALRPTADRVRETLFNWLSPTIEGSRCLDLFAGSGALGFEAASRGAAEVVMVEQEPQLVHRLGEQSQRLGANVVRVIKSDALLCLEQPGTPFDIVFLDPPFGFEMMSEVCARLQAGQWLCPGAVVYLEQALATMAPSMPHGWRIDREGRAGRVRYMLARCGEPDQ